ncbi:LysR substrate-binding domain-containing protein [Catenuloplanes sp. NPDC051500]|uniref:LysR substrate-binding domain-containing protein n=1 Tax=Catenuloplanes sp. NPDC051500 TaxID=3363959 RepID=UPI0037A36342
MGGFDIDVSALRSFVVLAIVRSYTAAAHELAITPSGLTKRIQTLERRLGAPLIIRDHGGVGGLTPAGHTLIRAAAGLLDAFERIALSAGRGTGPALRIGVQGLDQLVGRRRQLRTAALALRAVHPGASVVISLLGYEDPADALRRRRADLTLAPLPPPDDDVVSTRLWPLERIGVVPARHPLARRGEVDAEEFAAHPMLYLPAISAEFMSLWSLGDTRPLAGARLIDIAPHNFQDVYQSIGATGATLALHPEAARGSPRDLRTVALRGAPPIWYHVSRRRDARNAHVDAFLRFLRAR